MKPLSRFQSDSGGDGDARRACATARVDVVIGTHRLLSGEVRFKDLGLIVVDEEQRFGVEHKEKLKQLRTNVDVLAMSATPIPRTLEMAVTGIREMSTLATPPEERHPVLTFVGAYEEKQIAAAIRRELLREGQVFYVHNKVESIERAAARLRELVPEARIATAHGKMGEHRLEQVIVDFWEKRFDVLVCTTIVETGLDISNANTLVARARRPARPVPAAPAARPGRPRPRAGLRLLPVPARAAADRDGARPAADHRPAHRPRRRHAGGDEGPRDPRRGQPARRRAVRATSRASASTSTSGSSARPSRSSAASGARGAVEMKVELPGRRAPAARLRAGGAAAARGVPQDRRGLRRGRGLQASARSCRTGTARCRSRSRTCSPSPRCGSQARRAGLTEITAAGQPGALRAGRPARLGAAAAQAALPGLARQARRRHHARAAADDGAGRRARRCATRRSCAGRRRSSSRCSAARWRRRPPCAGARGAAVGQPVGSAR